MLKDFLSLILCAFCAGCGAGVQVAKVTPAPDGVQTGIPYNLGFTQYEITITRKLAECGAAPKILVSATAKPAKALDPSQMYVLSSSGSFDTSDLKGEYGADGVTTSLNATSEDSSPAVISNVIGGIVQIASLAAAAGGGGRGAVENCWANPAAALKRIPGERKAVEKDTADLAVKDANVTLLTAKEKPTAADKAALKAATALRDAAQDKLATSNKALTDDLDLTSYVSTIHWPSNGNDFHAPCDVALNSECQLPETPCTDFTDKCVHPRHALVKLDALDAASKKALDVFFRLRSLGTRFRDTDKKYDGIASAAGVPVRFAAPGRFLICTGADCDGGGAEIARYEDPILQLGPTYIVPVPQGSLHSGTAAISLADTGVPKSVQVTQKSAALAASGIFKDTATQANAGLTTIETAATTRLKAKTDALTAQKAYSDAKAALAPEALELKDLQNQAAVANAKAQLITSQQAEALAEASQAK